jgi:ABC-type glycerol-3-phosphate transport system permease component
MDFKIICNPPKLYHPLSSTCFAFIWWAPGGMAENRLAAPPFIVQRQRGQGILSGQFFMQMPFPACLAAGSALTLSMDAMDTWLPNLILIAIFIALPLRYILRRIPSGMEDAAIMDGCGFWRTLGHLLVPRLAPVLVIAAIVLLITGWEDVMSAKMAVLPPPGAAAQSSSAMMIIRSTVLIHGHLLDSGVVAALLMLLASPVIAFLYLAQQYVSRGRFTVPRA